MSYRGTGAGPGVRALPEPPAAGWGARGLAIGAALGVSAIIVIALANVQSLAEQKEPERYEDLRAISIPPPPPPPPTRAEIVPEPPQMIRVDVSAGDISIPIVEGFDTQVLARRPQVMPQFEFDATQFDPRGDVQTRSQVYSKSEVDQAAEMVYRKTPVIPPEILKQVDEPRVILLYIVNTMGRAEHIQVLHSASPEFDAIIIKAISEARFRPAMKNGKPVRQWVQQPLRVKAPLSSPFQRT